MLAKRALTEEIHHRTLCFPRTTITPCNTRAFKCKVRTGTCTYVRTYVASTVLYLYTGAAVSCITLTHTYVRYIKFHA